MPRLSPKKRFQNKIAVFYGGEVYRSKLQARWAVFMDVLGIKYTHQPYNHMLDDGVRYSPDFYLPALEVDLVVKADIVSESALNKYQLWTRECEDLVILMGFPVKQGYLFMGQRKSGNPPILFRDYNWGECPRCFSIVLNDYGSPRCECYSLEEMEEMLAGEKQETDFTKTTNLLQAYSKAKNYKFECRTASESKQPSLFQDLKWNQRKIRNDE